MGKNVDDRNGVHGDNVEVCGTVIEGESLTIGDLTIRPGPNQTIILTAGRDGREIVLSPLSRRKAAVHVLARVPATVPVTFQPRLPAPQPEPPLCLFGQGSYRKEWPAPRLNCRCLTADEAAKHGIHVG